MSLINRGSDDMLCANIEEQNKWLSSKTNNLLIYASGCPSPYSDVRLEDMQYIKDGMSHAMKLWEGGFVELVTRRSKLEYSEFEYIMIRRNAIIPSRRLFKDQYTKFRRMNEEW